MFRLLKLHRKRHKKMLTQLSEFINEKIVSRCGNSRWRRL